MHLLVYSSSSYSSNLADNSHVDVCWSLLVIATAAAQSCPVNQINSDAQIVTYGEGIIPADLITAVPSVVRNPALIDPNLTFSVKY